MRARAALSAPRPPSAVTAWKAPSAVGVGAREIRQVRARPLLGDVAPPARVRERSERAPPMPAQRDNADPYPQ